MALVLLLLFGGGCALVVLVRGTPSNWAGYNISAALTGVNSRRTSLYVWQLIVAFTLLSLLAWGTAANSDYSWADWRTQHVLAGITALGLIATLAALIALW
jgi:hypothetical protein